MTDTYISEYIEHVVSSTEFPSVGYKCRYKTAQRSEVHSYVVV